MRIIALLLLLPYVAALEVSLSVSEYIDVQVIGLENTKQGDIVKTSFEIFNSGSTGSNSRVRIDVFHQNKNIAKIWSHQFVFQPNDREFLEFYWPLQNKTGKFTINVRYYGSNEIKEIENYSFYSWNSTDIKNTIQIISPKMYKDKITFHVKTQETGEAYFIPLKYPGSWIIEQKKTVLYSGKVNYVEVDMKPDIWNDGTISVMIADKNGNYGLSEISIKRESFLNEMVFYSIKTLEMFLSKIL